MVDAAKKDGPTEDDDGDRFISGSAVRAAFGVSASALRNWANAGKVSVVRFGGAGKRLYRKADIEAQFRGYRPRPRAPADETSKGAVRQRARICYARVSSAPQRGDLERQAAALQRAYPDHELVTDVGSGINWRRPGLLSILDRAMRGDVQELVVAHRDRLCRFAFELLEHVLERAGCRLVVQHAGDAVPGTEGELKDDLLAILTVFVASNNGRRAAANRRARLAREREAAPASEGDETGEDGDGGDAAERDQMPQVGDLADDVAARDPQTLA